jgi:hypothetical protein
VLQHTTNILNDGHDLVGFTLFRYDIGKGVLQHHLFKEGSLLAREAIDWIDLTWNWSTSKDV